MRGLPSQLVSALCQERKSVRWSLGLSDTLVCVELRQVVELTISTNYHISGDDSTICELHRCTITIYSNHMAFKLDGSTKTAGFFIEYSSVVGSMNDAATHLSTEALCGSLY